LKIRRFAVVLCVLAFIAGACGSSSKKSASGGTTTTAAGGSSSSCKATTGIKIVGLAETTGEGAQAVPYFANGWQLGVDAVNAAGGICGQQISYERLPMSPTDNAQAKNTLLSALDKKADVLLGIVNSATVVALAPNVTQAATPTIAFSSVASAFLGAPNSVGSQWLFMIRPRNTTVTTAQIDYLVKTLGKKKIGLQCVNQTFGVQSCAAAKAAIEADGGTVVDQETNEVTDTNLTSKVLALKNKGADGIYAAVFPNNGVVFFNELADNDVNVPVFSGAIAGLAMGTGQIKPAAVKNLYGLDDCAPAVESRASKFNTAYRAKFGKAPSYSAAQAYDAIFIVKKVAEAAGGYDKAKIAAELAKLDYDGACTHYQADKGNGLAHSAVLETFATDGTPTVVKSVDIPPPANGG